MSEESTKVDPPAAVNADPPAPAKGEDDKNPTWLGPRLERERKTLLKELGIEDPEAAKSAIAAAKVAADAKKTAEEKAAELSTKFNASEAERLRMLAITKEHAARMIGVLTQKQQDAVRAIAGDDPALQLNTIGALSEVWAKEEVAKPATTAPPAAAPAAVVPGAPPNHKTQYQTIRATNPFEAAAYGLKHEVEVYKP